MKIVSGGQTGVDRAALDFAINSGIEHGGWCPMGRLAEGGIIPERYQLKETGTSAYAERTERNVADSDATLFIARSLPLSDGTLATVAFAQQLRKPFLIVTEQDGVEAAALRVQEFIGANKIQTLNIAGPRESQANSIGVFVLAVLTAAQIKPGLD